MLRRVTAVLLVSATAFAVGCGGDDEAPSNEGSGNGANELAASDAADVLGARRTINDACGGTQVAVQGQDLGEAVSTIAGILRLYPEQVYEVGNDDRAEEMKKIGADVVAQLRGCKQDQQANRLQQTLDALN